MPIAWPRDRGSGRRCGTRRCGPGYRRSGRRAVAWSYLWCSASTAGPTRRIMRRADLHRLFARRRVRGATSSPMSTMPLRSAKSADPVATAPLMRRPDRLAFPRHGGPGTADRPLMASVRQPTSWLRFVIGRGAKFMPHPAGRRRLESIALSLGACWAGGSDEAPPERLDAAILFAPVGDPCPWPYPRSAKAAASCGGIHMSDIPRFPTGCCGRSAICRRSPTSRAATPWSSWQSPPRPACARRPRSIPGGSQRGLADLPRRRFQGAAVLVP